MEDEDIISILKTTRSIVSEASTFGFDWKVGEWTTELYANNGRLAAAIKALEARNSSDTVPRVDKGDGE